MTLVPRHSALYPPQLARLDAAPALLYVYGDPVLLHARQLAVVGARDPTPGGRHDAREFARALASAGLIITSGLARGIDAAAHEGALAAAGRTLAALGSGLDVLYPPEHRDLAERMLARGGALVSEFPPGSAPRRAHFPRRNRLIGALSCGTLVIEAAIHSGSLITARWAARLGRRVFAVPGSIHNPLSRGCHALLRAGARLVESPADVLAGLDLPYVNQSPAPSGVAPESGATRPPALDKDFEILLDALGFEPLSIDALADRTGLPSPNLASMLLILELEGRIGLHAGGRYSRLHKVLEGTPRGGDEGDGKYSF